MHIQIINDIPGMTFNGIQHFEERITYQYILRWNFQTYYSHYPESTNQTHTCTVSHDTNQNR